MGIPWLISRALATADDRHNLDRHINRWDGVEPNRRMSNWSNPMQPTPNPHVPARFGQLVFVP